MRMLLSDQFGMYFEGSTDKPQVVLDGLDEVGDVFCREETDVRGPNYRLNFWFEDLSRLTMMQHGQNWMWGDLKITQNF
ncbi:hypothetical protein CapIbe_002486 [Capra ibex]